MSTPTDSAVADRLERWRRNLIDTSQRNRLINFRETSGVLRLTEPPAQAIFDRLVTRREELEMGLEQGADAPDKLLSAGERGAVERTLLNLRLKARAAQREQGINILFLSIGLLDWQDANGQALRSPLILIPVELRRSGPLQPYRVAALDDGAVLNPILEHKLRTEYQLELPAMPAEAGTSVEGVLELVRSKVAGTGWSVAEGACLGLFSFAKMPMYEELTAARDQAAGHPVVRALAGCPAELPAPAAVAPEQLDGWERASQVYQVLDADSSQQEAVALAKQGASFVLQGPPGTGKSQTIANIIAESLAKERTVLFVSEKMAALEVVKRRLDERGLGEFCLEMHSHLSSRQEVAAELGRCLQPPAATTAGEDGLDDLEALRERLNGHVRALHEVREGAGVSFFRINSELAALRDARDLPLQLPNLHRMSTKDLEALGPLVREVERDLSLLKERDAHPWRDCLLDAWKVSARPEMERLLTSCRDGPMEALRLSSELAVRYGLEAPWTFEGIGAMVEQLRLAASAPRPMASWLEDPSARLSQLEEMQDAYRELDAGMEGLRSRYDEGILSLDLAAMELRFRTEHRSRFRRLRRRYRQDMRALRGHRVALQRLDREEAARDLNEALKVSCQLDRVRRLEEECAVEFGEHFFHRSTDWEPLARALGWCKGYWERYGAPGPAMVHLISGPSPGAALREIEELRRTAEKAAAELTGAGTSFDLSGLLGRRTVQEVGLSEISAWAGEHLATIDRFPEWVRLNRLRRECCQHGLHELLALAQGGDLPAEGLWEAVRKRYFSLWHDHLVTTDRRLRDFRREEHAEAVERFRQLDKEQLDVAAARLCALLRRRRDGLVNDPSPSLGSAMWVLRHEVNRKKGLRPLRELFARAGEAILQLKPCLLMSPLSVSMHLDPARVRFDLVIFDEASQIRPEDAIGAIMRGRQVIIVGDTKQLPPTDFFRETSEDDEAEVPDLESILDECASCMPQRMLRWHYRSEDESLIAFSNRHFYGGRLFTFPSAGRAPGRGVSFVHVPEGCYDRGASRRNLPEAGRVADLVVQHFRQRPELSLGVVAFSEAQQMAILEELERRVEEEPGLSAHFREGIPEEFFVKNLESIQGDERDVVIFSLGYGKDAKGKMHQSLGPLNRAGGERRLNVAVTRARKALTVVSSILPSDLHPTSAGAELLKRFMEYARSGGARETLAAEEDRKREPLEEAMVGALEARGLRVHPRWGCSGYRVDLAVEDAHGRMVVAVETDGPTYRSGPTARDRERLRQEVLAKLGWTVHRTWSSDWVRDPDGEAERIARAVESAFVPAEETVEAVPEPVAVDVEIAEAPEGDVMVPVLAAAEAAPAAPRARTMPYRRVDWSDRPGLSARLRTDPSGAMREAVEAVVLAEGPVHPLVVHERVRELHKVCGLRKGSAEAEESKAIGELVERGRVVTRDSFLWPSGMSAPPVRSSAGGERRELWYVCMEELCEAILGLLDEGSLDEKTLVARTTALYGYKRPSPEARRRIAEAVDALVAEDRLVRTGDALGRRD